MTRLLESAALLLTGLVVALAGCGSAGSGGGRVSAVGVSSPARWTQALHLQRVVDLSAPRRDGSLVVAANGRLALLAPGGVAEPFAGGPGGYSSAAGEEPYLALSSGQTVPGAGCAFPPDAVYVLALANPAGITAVDAQGHVQRFATLAGAGLLDGITFDGAGRFGHRLLVTRTAGRATTVFAIDCRGQVRVVTRTAPKVEGGIAVAPATFGRFAGQLIAPDENSGRIFAIAPGGRGRLVAASGLPRGGDVGVESAGFVPSPMPARASALLADRLTPGNPHPGDDAILALSSASLRGAGVRGGDLLVATEGGARTDAVRCASTCRVRHVADGPAIAHAEGHIVFAPAP
ncbi:MAG TPA: hypothetical protein VGY97_11160 [Solirubrobacteraceae bacterium]|nr:hypothetical protein [Solirubrobacteraceae bacterium]